jgi:hypothetical protein
MQSPLKKMVSNTNTLIVVTVIIILIAMFAI